MMLHHISLPVADLERASRLYDAALAALGYRRVCSGPDFTGYGVEDDRDQFLLVRIPAARSAGRGFHIALAAPSRAAVDRFHELAVAHGAEDNGPPGLRPGYGPAYYAAFVKDLDDHRIEAVINGSTD
jgi:catechol 2,3-dioxygenase-like lactoylglutathione lyase family enzyme